MLSGVQVLFCVHLSSAHFGVLGFLSKCQITNSKLNLACAPCDEVLVRPGQLALYVQRAAYL